MSVTDRITPLLQAPKATRSRPPGWRNLRLVLGLVLVATSVLLGAKLLAAADDTVPVWVVTRELPAGTSLDGDDLATRRVRFADETTAEGYVAATGRPPSGVTLTRAVGRGELLPRAAVVPDQGPALVEVPLSVATDDLPATVRVGVVVDVWVAPDLPTTDRRTAKAVRVLREVRVVGLPGARGGLGPQTTRQLVVGLPAERVGELEAALGAVSGGRVIVARVG